MKKEALGMRSQSFFLVILFLLSFLFLMILSEIAPTEAQSIKWSYTLDFGGRFDYGKDVTIDGSGNIYVVGKTITPQVLVFISKFDRNGQHIWSKSWREGHIATAVTAGDGRIFLTGSTSYYTTRDDAFIVAFNTDGTLSWGPVIFGDQPNNDFYSPEDIAFDGGDYVYVTGQVLSTDLKNDLFIAFTHKNGYFKKSVRLNLGGDESGFGIYADANNVYVVGKADTNGILLKLDKNLNLITAHQLGNFIHDVRMDSSNKLWLVMGYQRSRLVRYDLSTGVDLAKEITYTVDGQTLSYHFSKIFIDEEDNIYLAGSTETSHPDVIVAKFKITSSGIYHLWTVVGSGSGKDLATGIVAGGPYAYVVGLTNSTSGVIQSYTPQLRDISLSPSSLQISLSEDNVQVSQPQATLGDLTPRINQLSDFDAFIMKLSDTPRLYLAVRGNDNGIYLNSYQGNFVWDGWVKLPGSTPSGVASVKYRGKIHLAVRGMNNKIYYGYLEELTGWFSGWSLVGGSTPSKPALTVDPYTGDLYLVVRGNDNRIYYNVKREGAGWSGWQCLPSGTTPDAPAALFYSDGSSKKLHIVVRGNDNGIWHGILDFFPPLPPRWSGWNRISGSTPSSPDLTIRVIPGPIYLAVRGADNRIYINYYDGAWHNWERIPTGTTISGPAIFGKLEVTEMLYVAVLSSSGDGRIYVISKSTSGWGTWQQVSGRTPSEPDLT